MNVAVDTTRTKIATCGSLTRKALGAFLRSLSRPILRCQRGEDITSRCFRTRDMRCNGSCRIFRWLTTPVPHYFTAACVNLRRDCITSRETERTGLTFHRQRVHQSGARLGYLTKIAQRFPSFENTVDTPPKRLSRTHISCTVMECVSRQAGAIASASCVVGWLLRWQATSICIGIPCGQ